MAKLYGIIGRLSFDWPRNLREWPVCWRLSSEDAQVVFETCELQRDLFLEELRPIHAALHDLLHPLSLMARGGHRDLQGERQDVPRSSHRPSVDTIRAQEARYRKQRAKLQEQEAEINRKHAAEMLDPLFPTCTNGEAPTVEYRLIEFLEDPREIGVMELIKLRAQLHGGQTSEDEGEPNYDG